MKFYTLWNFIRCSLVCVLRFHVWCVSLSHFVVGFDVQYLCNICVLRPVVRCNLPTNYTLYTTCYIPAGKYSTCKQHCTLSKALNRRLALRTFLLDSFNYQHIHVGWNKLTSVHPAGFKAIPPSWLQRGPLSFSSESDQLPWRRLTGSETGWTTNWAITCTTQTYCIKQGSDYTIVAQEAILTKGLTLV